MKRTQKWVKMQEIYGAQVVGRDRRVVSAQRSALYSMLDEAATLFPTIDSDIAATAVTEHDQEVQLDDDDEQWYAIISMLNRTC